jgi:LPXTG-motif cell wall-anchored protein
MLSLKSDRQKEISLDSLMSHAKTSRAPFLQTKAMVAFSLAGGFFLVAISLSIPMPVSGTETEIDLGAASSFAVLAGSGITNTGATTATGSAADFGSAPTVAFTGVDQVSTTGIKYTSLDPAVTAAQEARLLAYNDAASRTPVTTIDTELGGTTVRPGIYNSLSGTFEITGTLFLDAGDDPNPVWIFQTATTLVTATYSKVEFIANGDSCDVTWQVGSSATLQVGSEFIGNILAQTSISAVSGATIHGSLLAGTAVTLDSNKFVGESCADQQPTQEPTEQLTQEPTEQPTQEPTEQPTQEHTDSPSPEETDVIPIPERTTDSGGQLPNTGSFNWAASLSAGFGFISVGTGIHWTRRRSS